MVVQVTTYCLLRARLLALLLLAPYYLLLPTAHCSLLTTPYNLAQAQIVQADDPDFSNSGASINVIA